MQWADYILPALLILLMAIGLVKKVPLFDAFTRGAQEALRLVASVFPYLAAIFVCIVLFRTSGMGEMLAKVLTPVCNAVGVPPELTELIVVRPLSGSGSLAVLEDVYATYGADSHIGRCASVIVGSSETVFYISAVYFGTVRNKKLRYGLPLALICTIVGAIISCQICRFM